MVSYDPMLEYAHTVGRAMLAIADPEATAAVTADVRAEINAVARAGLGDLSGRAVQAVALDRLDPSPVQVAAADRLLHEQPLGCDELYTTVDPAAACVAAAHWLVAAAQVTAEAARAEPVAVFSVADDIEAVSVEVPPCVIDVVVDGSATPWEAVLGLLAEADAVRQGRIPDPAGLLQRVDAARDQIRRIDLGHREQALSALLDRLTPWTRNAQHTTCSSTCSAGYGPACWSTGKKPSTCHPLPPTISTTTVWTGSARRRSRHSLQRYGTAPSETAAG